MTEQEIKALQEEIAKAKADLLAAQNLNKSLQDEITEQEKAGSAVAAAAPVSLLPEKPVELDFKKYKIIYPRINHKGVEYTAHQIAKDTKLLKELVAMQHGGVLEVL